MKTFIVAFIDWNDNSIILEKIEAADWMRAVEFHSKYPYKLADSDNFIKVEDVVQEYPEQVPEEAFKQCCFDCDTMMNWIEI